MGLSGRVAIAPEPLRVTRERSRSGANRRPSMYASRKLHLDPEDEDQRDEEVWADPDTTQATIYGDYYADRKWSRQWLLPGFGFGNSRFADMLRTHASLPLREQSAAFSDTLAAYQGDYPQRDDITMLCFRFD